MMKYITASLVFAAYKSKGYYTRQQWRSAVKAYLEEHKQLKGEILTLKRFGFPLGTMMVSLDQGQLPVDKIFPEEMKTLRTEYGSSIAYCGKYAVWPGLEKKGLGGLVFNLAVYWVCDRNLDLAVMVVNPSHVGYYVRMGAEVVAKTTSTPGLQGAPSVLLALKTKESIRIQRIWRAEQERRQASGANNQVVPEGVQQTA